MRNWQINTQLKAYASTRQKWIEVLVEDPRNTEAAQTIVVINSKMDVYRSLWNWHDESVEMIDV